VLLATSHCSAASGNIPSAGSRSCCTRPDRHFLFLSALNMKVIQRTNHGLMWGGEHPGGRSKVKGLPTHCCYPVGTDCNHTHTHSPMETSLMSSAAACAPCTRARVHDDRSQWVSTLNTWASMPRPVPVRVANTRSEPWAGEPRAPPEWTSLEAGTQRPP